MPNRGQAREAGAEFFSGTMSGAIATTDGDGQSVWATGGVVGSMGEDRIAQSERIRRQPVERMFRGAPKFWKITNRAQLGNVKVWMGAFNGEAFPEGATSDKRTWLQPGQSMMVPLEAGLHFVGNVFDPRAPEAVEVIERSGGFELETEATSPGKNAPVRPIGGPIGLPDFIVEPIDGRFRRVGHPVAVYELYWNATKARIVRRRGHDREVLEAEKELLSQRLAEFTLDDMPVYGPNGEPLASVAASGDDGLTVRARSRGDLADAELGETLDADVDPGEDAPDMADVDPEGEPEASGEPARTRSPRGPRRTT